MALDLPALERPAKATSAPVSGGERARSGALVKKRAWRNSSRSDGSIRQPPGWRPAAGIVYTALVIRTLKFGPAPLQPGMIATNGPGKERMRRFIALFAVAFAVSVHAAEQRIVDTYKRACTVCHQAGVAGAPKLGDGGDWQQRTVATSRRACTGCPQAGVAAAPTIGDEEHWQKLLDEKGMAPMVESVRNGLSAMPSRGMCFDCSDDDYKARIQYMQNPEA